MSSQSDAAAKNVAMMRRFVMEIQQDGNYDLINELTHPDYLDHTAQPGMAADRDGVVAIMKYIHSVVSDLKIEIVHCISDGKTIATTKYLRGTQIGDIFGKPATNKPIEFRIMDFLVVADGRLKDHWATISPVEDK